MFAPVTLAEWLNNITLRRVRRDAETIIKTMTQMDTPSTVPGGGAWPEWHYGLGIMRAAQLRAGRMYPALQHLEEWGIIEGKFEEGDYPRRRFYRLKDLTMWDR